MWSNTERPLPLKPSTDDGHLIQDNSTQRQQIGASYILHTDAHRIILKTRTTSGGTANQSAVVPDDITTCVQANQDADKHGPAWQISAGGGHRLINKTDTIKMKLAPGTGFQTANQP
jgi:hypothetical protein